VDQVSKFQHSESVKQCRQVLAGTPLESFEIAQLANLLPQTAEEAKTLVPSIQGRIEDDELQALLGELHSLQRYVQ
jgi:DNA-directed RNA polymerase subunit F